MLSPTIAPLLKGIERADSLALDFHKWGQVPYDAIFFMVRDGAAQSDTFASPSAYLARHTRGLGGGSPWPCDLGVDLSCSFRALKTWFTPMCYGTDQLGAVMEHTCTLAQTMKQQLQIYPELELMAPVALNIVCFRHRCDNVNWVNADEINAEIVADLHESGITGPSVSQIHGHTVIRATVVNHRTTECDIDALLNAAQAMGRARCEPHSAD
nr:pyridoxal-dependent decarboxylase [Rhodoferax sp.]